MANFVHYSNVNNLFKKKNERVFQSRQQNQVEITSPIVSSNEGTKPDPLNSPPPSSSET